MMERKLIAVAVQLFLYATVCSKVSSFQQRCPFLTEPSFIHCANRTAEVKRYRDRDQINRVYNLTVFNRTSNTTTDVCPRTGICRRLYRTIRIKRRSLGAQISVHVAEMLRKCCANCTKYYQRDVQPPVESIDRNVFESADIVYPVYSTMLTKEVHGFYFIPVVKIPDAYFFTLEHSERDMAIEMVYACLRMWPLMTICLMLSLIAGFFVWILDTWKNETDFPRSFLTGIGEGFWWSFVSMTTVGYGDKSPKSYQARLFAMFWILIGITVISIYVATLTSEIMNTRRQAHTDLTGSKVGVLKGGLGDMMIVNQHGGILQEIEYNDTFTGIVSMVEKVAEGDLNGFLLTRPTYYYYARRLQEDHDLARHVRHVPLIKAKKSFIGDEMVAGMLMKQRHDFDFFRKYFESNWPDIQGCFASQLNSKDKRLSIRDTSNPIMGLFYPFFLGCLGIVGLLACFGVAYECRRRKRTSSASNQQNL